jgi:DNA-binding protein H-NS
VSEVPDISNLDYLQLSQLRAAVAERMKEMRDTGITQLRATISEQAQLLGVSIDDLLPKKKGGRGRAAAKYRDPDDPHNLWSGRGKAPRWMQELLNRGRAKEEFAIKESGL